MRPDRSVPAEVYAAAFDQVDVGMCVVDPEGRVLRANPALCAFLGRDEAELLALTVADVSHPEDAVANAELRRAALADGRSTYAMEKRYVHADGGELVALLSVTVVRDGSGEPAWLVGLVQDIAPRRALERELASRALRDPLTGVPNRTLLFDRLRQRLGSREPGEVALVFADLDGFKAINDSLGHGAGDVVLREVARRLGAQLRPVDTLARVGGDEFVVLCGSPISHAAADAFVRRLRRGAEAPLEVAGRPVPVRLSLGLVHVDGAGIHDPDELLRRADAAMYADKRARSGA
jgi:diguanylate cyclase (GGDEF)-like protein/PAS domain S-box-containing protein